MRRGFSVVEALVAVVLLGVGIAAGLGALSEMTRVETMSRETLLVRQLAQVKLDELRATGEIFNAPLDGTFEGEGLEAYSWEAEIEPSAVENLQIARLIVRKRGLSEDQAYRLTTLYYRAPLTTDPGGAQP